MAADLTDHDDVRALAEHAVAQHGHLDLLVHCAGLTHRSSAATTDPDVLRRVMAVNWEGPVRLTQAVLPLMRRGGTIVGLSSMAGWMPVAGRAAYGGSKAALWHYLEALRPEVARDSVGVLTVHPSFLDSVMTGADGGTRDRTQVGRPMSVRSVADQIVDGVGDGTRWLFPDRTARVASLLWHTAPGLYHRLMARRFAAELDGEPTSG